jgi:L-serine dehydratase
MAGFTLRELESVSGRASEWVLARDCAETGADPEALRRTMRERLALMRASIAAGLASREKSLTGMVGWNAQGLWSAPTS